MRNLRHVFLVGGCALIVSSACTRAARTPASAAGASVAAAPGCGRLHPGTGASEARQGARGLRRRAGEVTHAAGPRHRLRRRRGRAHPPHHRRRRPPGDRDHGSQGPPRAGPGARRRPRRGHASLVERGRGPRARARRTTAASRRAAWSIRPPSPSPLPRRPTTRPCSSPPAGATRSSAFDARSLAPRYQVRPAARPARRRRLRRRSPGVRRARRRGAHERRRPCHPRARDTRRRPARARRRRHGGRLVSSQGLPGLRSRQGGRRGRLGRSPRRWTRRVFAPMVSVNSGDGAESSGYGSESPTRGRRGGGGRRVGRAGAHPRRSPSRRAATRRSECLLPRAAAYDDGALFVACLGIDALRRARRPQRRPRARRAPPLEGARRAHRRRGRPRPRRASWSGRSSTAKWPSSPSRATRHPSASSVARRAAASPRTWRSGGSSSTRPAIRASRATAAPARAATPTAARTRSPGRRPTARARRSCSPAASPARAPYGWLGSSREARGAREEHLRAAERRGAARGRGRGRSSTTSRPWRRPSARAVRRRRAPRSWSRAAARSSTSAETAARRATTRPRVHRRAAPRGHGRSRLARPAPRASTRPRCASSPAPRRTSTTAATRRSTTCSRRPTTPWGSTRLTRAGPRGPRRVPGDAVQGIPCRPVRCDGAGSPGPDLPMRGRRRGGGAPALAAGHPRDRLRHHPERSLSASPRRCRAVRSRVRPAGGPGTQDGQGENSPAEEEEAFTWAGRQDEQGRAGRARTGSPGDWCPLRPFGRRNRPRRRAGPDGLPARGVAELRALGDAHHGPRRRRSARDQGPQI